MESTDPESDSSFYNIIDHQAKAEIKVKGSRFIAHADPVSSRDKCEEIISVYQKKYHNASHVCFAYRVGINDKIIHRCSDAGEPAGTAGSPIQNVITGLNLSNVIVLVIRYFGGTKLGIGGLIRAYTAATQSVLQKTEILKKEITANLHFQFSYEYVNSVLSELSAQNAGIIEQKYSEIVELSVKVPQRRMLEIRDNLINLCAGNLQFLSEQEFPQQ